MRTASRFLSVILLGGALVATGAGVAHAAPHQAASADALAAQAPTPTVPDGANQAVGDVLGLGYEQVIRFNGALVEIANPAPLGGAVLTSFWAGANGVRDTSRVAVLGRTIFVSTQPTPGHSDPATWVVGYSPDGERLNARRFPVSVVVTTLDAYSWNGTTYLAVGRTQGGVHIVRDVPGLPDVHQVGAWWPTPVTALKLGVDGAGQVILVAGTAIPSSGIAAAWDVVTGVEIWSRLASPAQPDNVLDAIDFGALGADGRQQVALGWKSGHVTFHDPAPGRERISLQTAGTVSVVRFYTNANGDHRVAIRADRAIIGGVDAQGDWIGIAEGPAADLPWLMRDH